MFKNEKPLEIIVLGPPISGKGTQTEFLAQTFGIPHISTGQILADIKADKTNPLAQEVTGFIDQGKLVPSELVNKLVEERFKKPDCQRGYAMDGYPRTLEQAQYIDQKIKLDYVFLIDVSDTEIVARMSGRRVCKNGHTWHLKYSPPKVDGVCDVCGEPLSQRDDDKEEVIKGRLNIYHSEADKILDFYEVKGILIRINGEQSTEEVYREIMRKMVERLRGEIEVK
ncbi:MAG: nucleoside monophosphate kinase [Patescibacteria group bacterium]